MRTRTSMFKFNNRQPQDWQIVWIQNITNPSKIMGSCFYFDNWVSLTRHVDSIIRTFVTSWKVIETGSNIILIFFYWKVHTSWKISQPSRLLFQRNLHPRLKYTITSRHHEITVTLPKKKNEGRGRVTVSERRSYRD